MNEMKIQVACGNCGDSINVSPGENKPGVIGLTINEDHCCRTDPRVNASVRKFISEYAGKIRAQEVLENNMQLMIKRKRWRREDYTKEAEELRLILEVKQAYIQAKIDIESLLLKI